MGNTISTIYKPSGKALEYGELALNIYNGCVHSCIYCFAPLVLKKDRQQFHASCTPRANIVEETKKYLAKHTEIKGQYIFICFTTDPFPMGIDHEPTRQIIKAIHDSGNFVQVLTKGILCDDDIRQLNENDILGITISCDKEMAKIIEPNTIAPLDRLGQLGFIKSVIDCKVFVSCEPVYEPQAIYDLITDYDFIDEYKIGKLNYAKSDIDWKAFGIECERLCKLHGRKYYIKESLRKEMEK